MHRALSSWAIIAILAAAGAALVVGSGSSGGSASSPSHGTDIRRDLAATVADIQDFVERRRGLKFKRAVKFQVESSYDVSKLSPEARGPRAERFTKRNEDLFQALGLIPASADLWGEIERYTATDVVGYYDAPSKALVLIADELTPAVRSTIAHELTHALEDQWFGVYRPELMFDRERGRAFQALGEGSAVTVQHAYEATLSPEEQRAAAAPSAHAGGSAAPSPISEFLGRYLGGQYVLGPTLVEAILESGGNAALNRALVTPPVSSEQVAFPARFLAGDAPLRVPTPRADGQARFSGTWGVELLSLLFNDLPEDVAGRALDGWGGSSHVVWGTTRPCVRMAIVGDTRKDTSEILTALRAWQRAHPRATVEGAQGRAVVTSCAAP